MNLAIAPKGWESACIWLRAILKHCGGEVWFESEVGEGSTFYFSLPTMRNSI